MVTSAPEKRFLKFCLARRACRGKGRAMPPLEAKKKEAKSKAVQ